jgi:glucose-1-phosphate thymidylyltransferase
MKGIILAGGSGTRLHPLTISVTKQLLPIYDKPMIYYPLSTLMSLGIKDILIICTPNDKHLFEQLLGDGKQFGINLSYRIQPSPDGLAQAFIIGEDFIGDDSVALVLGDNIFSGLDIRKIKKSIKNINGSMIFAYHVHDPERYGVVEFDEECNVVSLNEKPTIPKSNYAVPGLYFYDNSVILLEFPFDLRELNVLCLRQPPVPKTSSKIKQLLRLLHVIFMYCKCISLYSCHLYAVRQ